MGGSTLIVFGTVLAIAFGPSRVLQFTVDDLVGFWGGTDWIMYLIFNLSLAFGTQVCHMVYEKAHRHGKDLKYSATVLPVSFGVSSALAGSHCVVQASLTTTLEGVGVQVIILTPHCAAAPSKRSDKKLANTPCTAQLEGNERH